MRYRTEDLLTILDGGPIDAATRARLLADPAARAELDRLRSVRAGLDALPELDAPADGWQRVEAAVAARPASLRPALVAACAAAALGVLAVFAALNGVEAPPPRAAATEAADEREAPAVGFPARAAGVEDVPYRRLVDQSIELERLLASVPAPRPVMSFGTAGTIAGLEEQIAFVDSQLAVSTAAGWDAQGREALWSERVDLMTALVEVRLAQAQ